MPWHSDHNTLVADDQDVCYLTLGPANLLWYAPHGGAPLRQTGRLREERKEAARRAGLQGFVTLMPGDLFLATGSAQRVLMHKMLKYSDACNK